jgi:hypothetical protein
MVPLVGIELTTYRLQGGCSTPELKRLMIEIVDAIYRHRNHQTPYH